MINRICFLLIALLAPILLMAQSGNQGSKARVKPVIITVDSALFRPSAYWIDTPKELEVFFNELKGLEYNPVTLLAGDTKILIDGPCFLHGQGMGNRMVYPGDHLAIKFNEDQSSVIVYAPGDERRSMDLKITAIFLDSSYLLERGVYNIYRDQEIYSAIDLTELEKRLIAGVTMMCQRKRTLADSLLRSYEAGKDIQVYLNNEIINDSLRAVISFIEQNRKAYSRYGLIQPRLTDLAKATVQFWNDRTARYNQSIVMVLFDLILHSKDIETVIRTPEMYYDQKKIIDSFFTGYLKAFLWSNAIYSIAKRHIALPAEEVLLYKQDINNAEYLFIVEARIALTEKYNKQVVKPGVSRVTSMMSDKPTTIEAILKKYRGTLVLIDFWASWCGPCRQEMPSSLALDRELAGKVKFVYVSTDSYPKEWVKASNKEQIDPEHSFLFVDAHKADFFNRFKVKTIPRYLLFGKDGAIINDDAPPPSDKKLKELIEKNL